MKRFALTLLLVAALFAGVGVGVAQVSASPAVAPKPTAAPAIDCQHTTWRDMTDGLVASLGDGTNLREHLYSLRDSTSNSYCGQIRAQVAWNMPAGVCHVFTTQIYTSADNLVVTATSPSNCGNVSSYSVYKTEASGTYFGNGLVPFQIPGSQTGNWTVN